MDVSIILVNYNTLKLTNECIESIVKFTKGIQYEIIVVNTPRLIPHIGLYIAQVGGG